jgi:Flp pilus assembly protein TadG
MRKSFLSFFRRAMIDQRGQTLPIVALGITAFLGMAGLSIDVGHAYVVRVQLQNTANAAALAAAVHVYDTSAVTLAEQYDASAAAQNPDTNANGANYNPNLGVVTTNVSTLCINAIMPKGVTCATSPAANAVKVTNYATIKTPFMALFGVPKLTVGAKATASLGRSPVPWNIAVIIDSTGSMNSSDGNCGTATEFQCALQGLQTLLQTANPCAVAGVYPCDPSVANVRVSLFTFPNVLTAINGALPSDGTNIHDSIDEDISCNGAPPTYNTNGGYAKEPLAAPYTLPKPGATLPQYDGSGTYDQSRPKLTSAAGSALTSASEYSGLTFMRYTQTSAGNGYPANTTWDATYQITPFLSDYYDPNASSTSSLRTSSNLVKASGYGSTTGCLTSTFGIWGTGGGSHFGNTSLAGSIYEAQAALLAVQAKYSSTPSQNAIILLSDGEANASYYSDNSGTWGSTVQATKNYQFPSGPAGSEVGPNVTADPVPPYLTPASSNPAYGWDTLSSASGTSGNRGPHGKGYYPDWYDQCQQAVMAGQYATNNPSPSTGTSVFSVAYGAAGSGCSNGGWSSGITDTTSLTPDYTAPQGSFPGSSIYPCQTMQYIASDLAHFYSDNNQSGSSGACADTYHTTSTLADIFKAVVYQLYGKPLLVPNNAT